MGKTKVNYFFYILSIGLMFLIGLAMSLGVPIQEYRQKTNLVLAESDGILSFRYEAASNSYSISDCLEGFNGELVIPSTFDDGTNGEHPVTSINTWAFSSCSFTKVEIPSSITLIGNNAFNSCTSLESVTIYSTVCSIGMRSFYFCRALTEIYLWATYPLTLDPQAFTSAKITEGVGSIYVPSTSIETYRTAPNWSNLAARMVGMNVVDENLFFTYNSTSNSYAVSGCETDASGEITLPYIFNDGTNGEYPVTFIGEDAFSDCINVTSIIIPDSVTSIGAGAFSNCSNLTSVIIPDGITSIESSTFAGCESLTGITIPNSVTSIGSNAFSNCSNLTELIIPNNVTFIGAGAFKFCTSLTSIKIPGNVTSIENQTFYNCANLVEIHMSAINPITSLLALDAFEDSGITTSTGAIYVPSEAYITATNWSDFASQIIFINPYDLKNATSCTSTTVTINGSSYNTSGNIFYISDIDGLLTFSAIVGRINTSNTGHLDCGFNNSAGVANSMAGATIILLNDIDYNPEFIFEMNSDGTLLIKNKTTEEITTETPISWIPIGVSSYTFQGIFDGNDFKISGLYIGSGNYVGLFGYANNATIKNLAIENSYISGTDYVGGYVGYTNMSTYITNCYYTGNIKGQNNVGGLAGYVHQATYITDCYNNGDVKGQNNIGGLVGYANRHLYLTNSYNNGNINGVDRVGGLVGYASYQSTYLYITSCYNNGNISGQSNVGGLAGYACSFIYIKNSYNTGSIIGTNENTGGIAGYVNYNVGITNCYNSGNISGVNNVGGIIGYIVDYTSITNCYNTGSINGQDSVAGIVGYIYYELTMTNCYNSGNINGTYCIGGIVGYLSNGYNTIYMNNYNTGDISGLVCVGGIIGCAESRVSIEKCYNTGKILGSENVGGIAGYAGYACSISYCHHSGTEPVALVGNGAVGVGCDNESINHIGIITKMNQYLADSGDAELSLWQVSEPYLTMRSLQDYNLNLVSNCTETTLKIGDITFETNGATFYITDIDGLLTLSAIVGGIDTSNTGHTGGFDNSTGVANSMVGATIILLNDIDYNPGITFGMNADGTANITGGTPISWLPIGVGYDNLFKGVFDGGDKKISGLYINDGEYIGLFSYIEEAEIKNVVIENSYLKGEFCGGISGYSYNSTILNCRNTGSLMANANTLGGIVGYTENSEISSCGNTGNINNIFTGGETGGIVGVASDSLITYCYNDSTVNGDFAGGIVSYVNSSSVANCYSNGNINGVMAAGGVAGVVIEATIINCYNLGSVDGAKCVGGIIGILTSSFENSKCINCYNLGRVGGENYIGGIAGYNEGQIIDNCFNTGFINGGNRVGGLVGYNKGVGLGINNSYNTGIVSGINYVGGFIGYNKGTITNSHNDSIINPIGDGYLADESCGNNAITHDGILDKLNDYVVLNNSEFTFELSYWEMQGANRPALVNDVMEYSVAFNLTNATVEEGEETCEFGTDYTANITLEDNEDLILVVSRNGEIMTQNKHYTFDGSNLLIYGKYIIGDILINTFLNDQQLDLKDATGCTETQIIFNGINYDTNGATFYISDIDGLLKLSAIVGKLNTSSSYFGGLDNSTGVANSMLGATIVLTHHIFYNSPNFVFNMDENGELVITNEFDSEVQPYYWSPIGSLNYPFKGTFDGDGYNLYGILVNSTNDYAGLFGYSLGTIKNISLQDSFIKGKNYVGAIAGFSGGNIESCFNNGIVSGADYVGGIAGSLAIYKHILNSCNTDSKIYGNNYVGGITGQSTNGKIQNCYNTSEIICNEYIAGGITGINFGEMSEISNSYNTANVTGNRAGGLAGFNYGTINSSYNTATTSGVYIGGLTNCNRGLIENSNNSGTPAKLVGSGTLVGAGCGQTAITHDEIIVKLNEFVANASELNLKSNWQAIDIYLVVFNTEISYDLKDATACSGGTVTINRHVIHTSNTTFYISDIDGLLSFNAIVNGIDTTQVGHIDCGLKNTARFANTMQDSTIVLLNDIDYNPNFTFDMAMEDINNHEITGLNYAAGDPIILDAQGNATEETPISWIPIGSPGGWYYDEELDEYVYSEYYVFNGIFDGNNHTISGLYYNENWDAGLFGYVNGAEIKNLGIENSYFGSLYGYAGGIVAWAENAVITNCYNTGNVKSGFSAGGIVGLYGYLGGYADSPKPLTTNSNPQLCGTGDEPNESIIMNCYNTGKILAYCTGAHLGTDIGGPTAGGLAGMVCGQQIIDSYNNGNISGIDVYADDYQGSMLGGIMGYSEWSMIANCYNSGNINGVTVIGGLVGFVGYYTSIINCYNSGDINGATAIGGLVGSVYRGLDFTNCYNTGEINAFGESVGGLVGYQRGYSTNKYANSYNIGNVNGSNEVGGIIGCAENNLSIKECYNAGNIVGLENVGGLVGSMSSSVEVTNCHNSGLVNETKATLENLVGAGTVGEGCDNEDISHFGIINKLNEFITDETSPYTLSEWQFAEPYLKCFGIQDLPRNLKDATECTATTITIDGVTYETNGTTFYIDDIDGFLTFSAIVGGIDTTGIYDNCGFVNSKDNANSMTGAIIMLIDDIDYNPGVTFNMNSDGTANISGEGTPVLWKPIGLNYEETDYAFSGTFNGNSFTISGLYVENVTYAGLFGLANSAEINDINVENSYMSGNFCGGIVAVATNTTLTNCGNSGNISSFEDYGAGGIVCDASESTIINCDNSGNINVVSGYSGGIVAWASENTIIQKCNNSGDINGSNLSRIGGIVGAAAESTIINCCNSGEISVASGYSGGIVACASENTIIQNCCNFGNINSSDLSRIGGIVGEAGNTTINNCQNSGNINLNNNGESASYVGGIAGLITLNSTIAYCNNKGSIEGINLIAGGVVAFADLGSSIIGCYNLGDITITAVTDSIDAFAGGIVGVFTSNLTSYITNCCNTANITIINQSSNVSYIGGIVALVSGESMCDISYCYNNGEITSTTTAFRTYYAGGIAGYASNVTMINCYNSNIINADGDSISGGIIGYTETSTIINCYNTGDITGNSAGGIVGNSKSDIINCYNSGTITGVGVDYVGAIVGNLINGTVTYSHHFTDKTPAKLIGSGTAGEGCSIDTHENVINNLNDYVTNYTGELDLSEWQLLKSYLKVFGAALDLRNAISCTATTVTINGDEYNTNGTTFYISNIDGLLSFSAIVGGIDTLNTGHLGGGFNNSAGVANSMAGATIILLSDIDYNPGFTFGMNEDGTADISGEGTPASWMPIGNSSYSFQGTFDGNNFKISGLYVESGNYVGLFGYATNTTIKNLTIENSYLGGTQYVGGLAGYINNATITNCHNYANAYGSSQFVGGLAGYMYRDINITNCHNSGDINGANYIGGFAGYAYRYTYITNCYNNGNINGTNYVGGFAGSTNSYIYITNCYNTGNIKGSNESIGGLVGYARDYAYVTNCYNSGNINGTRYVGGLVGYIYYELTITNCYNAGDISKIDSDNNYYVGGLVGYVNDGYYTKYTNSYNAGNVNGVSQVGGIIGYANNLSVEECYNTGNISGINNVGGLVGSMGSSVTVTNCHNSGLVNEAEATLENLVGDGTVGEGCGTDAIDHAGIISKLDEYVTNYTGELDLLNWREQPEPYLVFV